MKATRMIAVTTALLVALGGTAFAQGGTVGYDGQKLGSDGKQLFPQTVGGLLRADSTARMLGFDASNNALFHEGGTWNRDNVTSQQLNFTTNVLAYGNADSCGPVDVRQYRYLKLIGVINVIDSVQAQGATAPVRIIFQLREHLNGLSDSTSIAGEYQPSSNYGISTAITADTCWVGQAVLGTALIPSSGERVLYLDGSRNGGGTGLKFTYPKNVAFMIQTPVTDQWQYFSLRIRLASVTQASQRISYTWYLLGWS